MRGFFVGVGVGVGDGSWHGAGVAGVAVAGSLGVGVGVGAAVAVCLGAPVGLDRRAHVADDCGSSAPAATGPRTTGGGRPRADRAAATEQRRGCRDGGDGDGHRATSCRGPTHDCSLT